MAVNQNILWLPNKSCNHGWANFLNSYFPWTYYKMSLPDGFWLQLRKKILQESWRFLCYYYWVNLYTPKPTGRQIHVMSHAKVNTKSKHPKIIQYTEIQMCFCFLLSCPGWVQVVIFVLFINFVPILSRLMPIEFRWPSAFIENHVCTTNAKYKTTGWQTHVDY